MGGACAQGAQGGPIEHAHGLDAVARRLDADNPPSPRMRPEFVVVGAGAIGASTALHLARAGHDVVVVEKEPAAALHQSSRNSGVVHAGYNVKPGSQKARFCIEGNRRLREYCAERGIPVAKGGILIVARDEREARVLVELERRSKQNGVDVRMLDEAGIREVEPHAHGIQALHAREGASFDSHAYVRALVEDATAAGARFRYGVKVHHMSDGDLRTSAGRLAPRVMVNAAGLYADVLARELAPDLRVVPFRGYYAELLPNRRDLVRSHIYAAPDLDFPFLGVHLSRRTDGRVIAGPGAMLAFGREAYSFWSVAGGKLGATLTWPGFWRMLRRQEVRDLMRREVEKSLRLKAIWAEAQALVPVLHQRDLVRSFAGNRAQLVGTDGRLVDDIIVRETAQTVHVLNAVSPGLTCSLPFGEHLAALAAAKR